MSRHSQLHIRLPQAQKQQLSQLATQRRVSLAALVESAVTALLTQQPSGAHEGVLVRRLDRMHRQVQACLEQEELLTETLALFVRLYLATTGEVPPAQKADAARRGGRRYTQFIQTLRERLEQGQRLMSDVERSTNGSTLGPAGGEDDAL